ncbi:protein of unassigned function [Methylobacterium oryzae CBMB20]|uniref:Protein of unassigned function n=1 Tax=Methylobacterium oryzae CBMB20 TaxID=693986 RepID=A0A089NQP9_9HYPH|nr:protein of unassigned function [Methylobacterium oryzae CBMB20]
MRSGRAPGACRAGADRRARHGAPVENRVPGMTVSRIAGVHDLRAAPSRRSVPGMSRRRAICLSAYPRAPIERRCHDFAGSRPHRRMLRGTDRPSVHAAAIHQKR